MIKLQCPECQHSMSTSAIKPGSYRPKCKRCGKPFSLKVTSDDPPKIVAARIKSGQRHSGATAGASPVQTSASSAARPTTPSAAPSAATSVTIDPAAVGGSMSGHRVEAAADPEATADSVAVMDADATAATMDGAAGGTQPASIRSGTAVDGAARSRQASVQPQPSEDIEVPGGTPTRLGGYRIIRTLGGGAMGEVYEAKQVSLDRAVALKTIKPSLAENASSLARFTREAYAAAQMTHHNVVQIFDFGEDRGRHFFSMEWVRGGPLDALVRRKGSLTPRLAASYTLQAARGLQMAHAGGMIHRDIKPANLLLTEQGVIKVADLGLVKIDDLPEPGGDVASSTALSSAAGGTEVTLHGTAVGTPAYMAPEQATDAASVDHRADLYSLGCTLYYLLCGRPPYPGKKVRDVIELHCHAPIPDPTSVKSNVPPALAAITMRCMAKQPRDRYQTAADLIADLETFLDIRGDETFSPTAEQADQWSGFATAFASAQRLSRLRRPVAIGGLVLAAVVFLLTPWFGLSMLLAAPVAVVAAVLSAGMMHRVTTQSAMPSPLFQSLRRRWDSQSIGGRLLTIVGTVVVLIVAVLTGMWIGLMVGAIVGVAAGVGYHVALVAPVHKKSEPVVRSASKFVRNLRLAGTDEDAIRSFAARQGGRRWRALFTALFGYHAATEMRRSMEGDRTFDGDTTETLYDRVVAAIDRRTAENLALRDAKRLAKIEKRGLRQEGLSAADAEQRSRAMAAAVIENSRPAVSDAGGKMTEAEMQAKRERIKAMLADARSGKYKPRRDPLAPIRFLLGGQTRLLAGLILLAVFAVWGRASGLFDSLSDIDVTAVAAGDLQSVQDAATQTAAIASQNLREPLTTVGSTGASLWSICIAGVLLTMSAFVSGWKMTPLAVIATIVILWGANFGIPPVAVVPAWCVAAAVGLVVYVPGLWLGER